MKNSWKVFLSQKIKAEFGDSAPTTALRKLGSLKETLAPHLRQHQELAEDTFNAIMLALRCSSAGPTAATITVAKQVSSQLLAQIAQDIIAISQLTTAGFAYQAVSIAASTFEHSWMLASIGTDSTRAQQWLDHTNEKQNIDNVKDRVRVGLRKLDRKNPGLKTQLGDPYEGMYKSLCAFKHGNPLVQQHIVGAKRIDSDEFVVFPIADRRALIAAYWAIEAAIRSGWVGLVSFVGDHVANVGELREIINGINRSANGLRAIRAKIEEQQE
jgi:hypothetical protein